MLELKTKSPDLQAVGPSVPIIPQWAVKQVEKFLLDKGSGNVTLNIKEGRILGLRIETLYSPP